RSPPRGRSADRSARRRPSASPCVAAAAARAAARPGPSAFRRAKTRPGSMGRRNSAATQRNRRRAARKAQAGVSSAALFLIGGSFDRLALDVRVELEGLYCFAALELYLGLVDRDERGAIHLATERHGHPINDGELARGRDEDALQPPRGRRGITAGLRSGRDRGRTSRVGERTLRVRCRAGARYGKAPGPSCCSAASSSRRAAPRGYAPAFPRSPPSFVAGP